MSWKGCLVWLVHLVVLYCLPGWWTIFTGYCHTPVTNPNLYYWWVLTSVRSFQDFTRNSMSSKFSFKVCVGVYACEGGFVHMWLVRCVGVSVWGGCGSWSNNFSNIQYRDDCYTVHALQMCTFLKCWNEFLPQARPCYCFSLQWDSRLVSHRTSNRNSSRLHSNRGAHSHSGGRSRSSDNGMARVLEHQTGSFQSGSVVVCSRGIHKDWVDVGLAICRWRTKSTEYPPTRRAVEKGLTEGHCSYSQYQGNYNCSPTWNLFRNGCGCNRSPSSH